jgi:hypothetical protein
MKIATWNLEGVRPGFGARSQRFRDAIAPIDPDVWVLTESHPDFVPAGGYARIAVSAEAPDRVRGGRWVVIWARTGLAATALALTEEPDRAAAVLVRRPVGRPLVLFGAVLPWRGDKRHGDVRGGKAFVRSLELQSAAWSRAKSAVPGAELCVAGDFNQEFGACGPVGTQLGCDSFAATLAALDLTCITGGKHDPLSAREWRASIDHILLSRGLRAEPDPKIWPTKFPLSSALSDHYGVCLCVADA